MTDLPKRVACIGTGTVGASWAAFFLSRGIEVMASDPAPGAEALLMRRLEDAWPALVALGLAPGASLERITFFDDATEAAEQADFVQESAPERREVKEALLTSIDAATNSDVIIASSSSGLLASQLQAALKRPERFVIGHPFNPPHLMPLVEVVGGKQTPITVVDRAIAIYLGLGKRPIHVRKEVAGHIANRLQAAVLREALHLLREGVATVADIDAAMVYGPGLRWAFMGPFLTFHLAGGDGGIVHFLDHLAEPYNAWIDDLGNDRLGTDNQDDVIAGVTEMVGERSIGDLVSQRDAALLALLNRETSR